MCLCQISLFVEQVERAQTIKPSPFQFDFSVEGADKL